VEFPTGRTKLSPPQPGLLGLFLDNGDGKIRSHLSHRLLRGIAIILELEAPAGGIRVKSGEIQT